MTNELPYQNSKLCSAIRTANYSRKIVTLLRDISANLFKMDAALGLGSVTDKELKDALDSALEGVDRNDPVKTEERLMGIIKYLKSIEEVKFVIPVYPQEDFLKRLHAWCAENINEHILLDITTNRLMESGFLMIYKGHYFEYSLENLLNEYFSSHDMTVYLNSPTQNATAGL